MGHAPPTHFLKLVLAATLALYPSVSRAYTWEDLKALLASRSFGSIEELIGALPEEMQRNYVLQAGTESPQPASGDAPRVLLHTDDAKLIVAVAGGPGGRPISPVIEVTQFNDRTSKVEPHAIELKAGGPPRVFEDPNALFPPGHPKNCFRCHGKEFKFIWDSYPFWPRSFGSTAHPLIVTHESERFKEFVAKNGGKGIYKHLVGLEATPLTRLESHNTAFTQALTRLHERRIFAELRDNPTVRKYGRQIVASLMWNEAEMPARLLPVELRVEYEQAAPRYRREMSQAATQYMARKVAAYEKLGHGTFNPLNFDAYPDTLERHVRLRFFMDKAGIDMSSWPMTLESGTYSFASPIRTFGELEALIFNTIVLPTDPSLHDTLRYRELTQPVTGAPRDITYSYLAAVDAQGSEIEATDGARHLLRARTCLPWIESQIK